MSEDELRAEGTRLAGISDAIAKEIRELRREVSNNAEQRHEAIPMRKRPRDISNPGQAIIERAQRKIENAATELREWVEWRGHYDHELKPKASA